jgi:hypothetical protein
MADARRYCVVAALALVPAIALPMLARAQEAAGAPIGTAGADTTAAVSSTYDRGHNEGVVDAPRPSYEALGIRAGAFLIYPKVALTGDYDDNIFAVQSGVVGDFIFDVAPEVDVQSNWSRNAVTAYVRLDQDAYAHYSDQDTTQYAVGGSGKLQFGAASDNTASVDYGHYALPRNISNNFGDSEKPLEYDYVDFKDQLTLQFNRVRASLRFDDQDTTFENGQTAGGAAVIVSNESHNDQILTGRVEYALSPDAAVDVEAEGNHRDYGSASPATPFPFTSSGYQINAGANFDFTRLIRGQFQIGYLSENYASSAFKPVQGLSGNMRIEWFPTRLTTLTFTASRDVGPSLDIGSAGYVGSRFGVEAQHSLLRNLILAGNLGIAYNQDIGIDRNDTVVDAGVSANWLISRHIGVKFAYAYANQKSVGIAAGNSFVDNRGTLSLILQL